MLDSHQDEWLFEAGVSCQIVSRVLKFRKECGLELSDKVVEYFESLDEDKSVSDRALHSQDQYIKLVGEENIHGVSGMSCNISLARPV